MFCSRETSPAQYWYSITLRATDLYTRPAQMGSSVILRNGNLGLGYKDRKHTNIFFLMSGVSLVSHEEGFKNDHLVTNFSCHFRTYGPDSHRGPFSIPPTPPPPNSAEIPHVVGATFHHSSPREIFHGHINTPLLYLTQPPSVRRRFHIMMQV